MPNNVVNNFKIRSELNPKLWQNDKLRSEVRTILLKIAVDVIKSLELETSLDDITFTGSLANYNYSKYSDIDLHIILNFNVIDENETLVRDFLLAKKTLWNDMHEIKIRGAEVEIYFENIGDPHHSTGIYSVLDNNWIKKPLPSDPDTIIDLHAVMQKANDLISQINYVISLPIEDKLETIETLQAKIKRMRKCGLETEGEYSVENLAFKVLRNEGHIRRLWDEAIKTEDELLSLESIQ
ncbi:MAG: hypothetical protein HOF24_02680 [Flavobacteriaceae bacterium]|jgi:predicted nucleotidyltransferase|nr:hypothetical protein [Flavobacteriaceae bacterium]